MTYEVKLATHRTDHTANAQSAVGATYTEPSVELMAQCWKERAMSTDEDLAHASRMLEAAIAARHVTLKIDKDLLRTMNTSTPRSVRREKG
jgi:hypothetical protein